MKRICLALLALTVSLTATSCNRSTAFTQVPDPTVTPSPMLTPSPESTPSATPTFAATAPPPTLESVPPTTTAIATLPGGGSSVMTLPPPGTPALAVLCLAYLTEAELSGFVGAPARLVTFGSGLASPGHLYCDYVVEGYSASRPIWVANVECGTLVADEINAGGEQTTAAGYAAVYTTPAVSNGAYEELLVNIGSTCIELIDYRATGSMREGLLAMAELVVPRIVSNPPPG